MAFDKSPEMTNIFRIEHRKKTGVSGTYGWQVRIYRDGKPHTRQFSDSKFGSKDAALIEAKKFRDELYKELGCDSPYLIREKLPVNNTSGILGLNRSEWIDADLRIYECWQTTFPNPNGGQPKNRKFDISQHGEIGALYKAVEARMEGISQLIGVEKYFQSQAVISRLIDKYLNILIYLESLVEEEKEILVKTLLDKTVKNTVKEDIINARVGQQSFKDKLVKLKGGKCEVTGARHLLNSSHIKPWAVCTGKERLDPFNGFLLSPLYDRAFDAGLISFGDSGDILISPEVESDVELLGIDRKARINVSPFSLEYLKYHRDNIFRRNAS